MTIRLAILILACFFFARNAHPSGKISEVIIRSASDEWTLVIGANGSGNISFGANIVDSGQFPSESLPTATELAERLRSGLTKKMKREGFLVYLIVDSSSVTEPLVCDPEQMPFIAALFSRAFKSAKFYDPQRISTILKDHPFVMVEKHK